MVLRQAVAAGPISIFKHRLLDRMKRLSAEFDENDFIMPVGIFLLIDEKNGGDITAQELKKRFNLLNFESRNIIDFYFLGWSLVDERNPSKGMQFDLNSFQQCRAALKKAGITKFGGNADLILVDAHFLDDRVSLDFTNSITIDLAVAKSQKKYDTLGEFLQTLIDTTEQIRREMKEGNSKYIFKLSDQLGLSIAKKSLIENFLRKFGNLIGSTKIAIFAVKNVGPVINLKDL